MSLTKEDNRLLNLDAAFEPKSIAVIGASNDSTKLGGNDMKLLIESGYKGKIFPINPKEDFVQGYKAYKSVLDVPEDIERASIILPTKFVPEVVKDCAKKGVKVVQIYSAGFGEFGEEGKLLESEMVEISKKYNMRIIGPNCIGTYCPSSGISFTRSTSMTTGNIAFVSQSGGIAFDIVNNGEVMGIKFSKVISVGNCIDLDHADYLEYLKDDDNTKAIGLYIESVNNGQRFLKVLKETTKKKPVIILKGGRTEGGSQSVASHTGNLAGNYQIWEALFEQTGTISVKSIEDMLTVLLCIQELKGNLSRKIALIGNGGGATVLATDYLEEVNLQLATANSDTVSLFTKLGVASNGRNVNPIDLPATEIAARDGQLFGDIIRAFVKDKEINNVLFHLNLIPFASNYNLEEILHKFSDQLTSIDLSSTNLVGVYRSSGDPKIENIRYEAVQKLQKHGIPMFRTIEQAAYGLSMLTKH